MSTFTVASVEIREEELLVLLHGHAEGEITRGMEIDLPFNPSFSAGCEIDDVTQSGGTTTIAISAEDVEEAEFIATLNVVGEALEVRLP